ncbi:MAG: aspartyl protease [Gemmatimonadetes bacterium GWC2_71_10]|nr:MAG: aspartyl protease [Gemmatimonadetes bacterium GWC2_71_10]
MSLTYIDGIVQGPAGEAKVRFLIDSGAELSLLPERIWKTIGLVADQERTFSLADGTHISRKVSECRFTLPQGSRHSPVVLGEPSDPDPLLGIVTLETMGLVFDPFRRLILPMRALLLRVS